MRDPDTEEFIRRRAQRAAGMGALRQIRRLVDDWDRQEQGERQLLRALLPLFALLFAAALLAGYLILF